MPKAIEGAHEAILKAASRLLASEGYANLNMRAIAAESGVATGTVYNYYGAKDELVFALMKEDWKATLARLDKVIAEAAAPGAQSAQVTAGGAASKSTRLRLIFDILHGFTSKYASVWRLMATEPVEDKSPSLREYETGVYIREIVDRIRSVLADGTENQEDNALLPPLLARIFSVFAMDREPNYASLDFLLERLLR